MKIAVIHGSSRQNGNAEYLAYHAVPKEKATHIHLQDYHIQQIIDERHEVKGFKNVHDDHKELIDLMLRHEIIVFSTPIYWYSLSGPMKTFIDRWSQIMRDPNYAHFRGELKKKKAYLIAVGGDNPTIKGLPLVQQFNYICQFFGMEFAGYVLGQASKPGDIKNNKRALDEAAVLVTEINL
ncbi:MULTISPECIES: flavodoxin family protein [Virgibacillus]|uniref:Flavodoxin family protein n=1 Tax=Virgibacillus halodenitrificans TaxID=1482 RepID=A0AAC9J5M0_VIRHA|nr:MULTISPECIES: flavodoxin family protein [Virgibacillus]AIF44778.1 NAD(P)H-dependent oxidoreductase [Virgibacillus sp. SK37]APC49865.1 NAD(P)H-dependent oxidoreductase [Virgibacillus halodenitrificans]MBD1223500.1 flavodoxin family protein [Virgibacillus halodenitrificans]MCG1029143.1 flavodoxin family protein [Virgibacillus halodenitrificans]MCJ0932752.1 flavodoxin family protein [Virgibacillus halodenitrificans]